MYEYSCRACHHQFETLVRASDVPACPSCGSADLERLLSLPAIKSETTHALALAAAKRRDKKQGVERMVAQREYELKHND